MNKKEQNLVVITTPALSSHQVVHVTDLADIYIPADIYRRFSNLNGTPCIIIGGMNYFSQESRKKAESENTNIQSFSGRNFNETKLMFSRFDIDLINFIYTDQTYYYYMVERAFSLIRKQGYINDQYNSLNLNDLRGFINTYLEKINKFPADKFDELINQKVSRISPTIKLCSNANEYDHGYETCFAKGQYYDQRLVETMMSNIALWDLCNKSLLTSDQVKSLLDNTYYNVHYLQYKDFVNEVCIHPATIAAMGEPHMIPTDLVLSIGMKNLNINVYDFCDHVNMPYGTDMFRGTSILAFPYQHDSYLNFKSIFKFFNRI
jgi:hypothetical protein